MTGPGGEAPNTSAAARDATEPPAPAARRLFRRRLVSVLAIQAVTLVLLWLLQVHYTH